MTDLVMEVDEKDNELGVRPKNDFYGNPELIHRGSHLLLFNSSDELLIQKRAKNKVWYPLLYTYSVSESVGDESYEEGIDRGMNEELGILVPCKKLFKYYFKDGVDNAFRTVFLANSDITVNVDMREAESFRWVHISELEKMIKSKPELFTPPFLKGLKIYFERYKK